MQPHSVFLRSWDSQRREPSLRTLTAGGKKPQPTYIASPRESNSSFGAKDARALFVSCAAQRSGGARRGEEKRGVGQELRVDGRAVSSWNYARRLQDVREERRTGLDERAGRRLATAATAAAAATPAGAAAAGILRDR